MSERIINNHIRIGNFTSSKIVALLSMGVRDMTQDELMARPKKGKGSKATTIIDPNSFGKPALTYIEEKNWERKLELPLNNDVNSRPTTWGNVCEEHAFELLGTEYKITSQETYRHPQIEFWCGSPDGNKFDDGLTVWDLKCPKTRKSFCQLVDPLYNDFSGMEAMNKIRESHEDGETYYWQLISNSILMGCKYAELIVYMPYQSELDDIRDLTQSYDGPIQNKVAWINFATDEDLPYIRKGGYYKNINIVRFEVPQEDKELLTSRVIEAGKLLIKI